MGAAERLDPMHSLSGADQDPFHGWPTWVKAGDRELAAWVHCPSGPPIGGLVIVGSVGREGVAGFRTLRHLALAAARRGFVSVRMTLSGAADSGPLPATTKLDAAWVADLDSVVAFTRQLLAPGLPVHRIGLRLGAAVVASTPARAREQRVLWEPVSGRSFLREQQLLRRVSIYLPVSAQADCVELLGAAYSRSQADSLTALTLPEAASSGAGPDVARGWWVRREDDPDVARKLYAVPSRFAEIPYGAVDELVSHLVSDSTSSGEAIHPSPISAAAAEFAQQVRPDVVSTGPSGRLIRESMVLVGPSRAPGILVAPLGEPSRAVLFIAPASEPKDGPTGLWAKAARALAENGVTSLRADRQGAGELMDETSPSEPQPYTDLAVQEVVEQIEWLQSHTGLRVSGVGICSSSWLLLRAGARQPLDHLLSFNNSAWAPSAERYRRLFQDSLVKRMVLMGASGLPDETSAPEDSSAPKPSLLPLPRSRTDVIRKLKATRGLLHSVVPPSVRRLAGTSGRVHSPHSLLAALPSSTQVHLYFSSADMGAFDALHGPSMADRLRSKGRKIQIQHATSLDHSLLTESGRQWALAEILRVLGHAGVDGDGPGG